MFYLDADCDAHGDDEDGNGELVKDAERAEDVAEDLLEEERLHEHGDHPEDVHDVEHGHADDDRGHEGLQVAALSGKKKNKIHLTFFVSLRNGTENRRKNESLLKNPFFGIAIVYFILVFSAHKAFFFVVKTTSFRLGLGLHPKLARPLSISSLLLFSTI